MRTFSILVQAPILDDDLGLPTIGEQIVVQAFGSEMSVEALDKRIFPRAVRANRQFLFFAVHMTLLCLVDGAEAAIDNRDDCS